MFIPRQANNSKDRDTPWNQKLLTNICDTIRNLILYCNAGKAVLSKKGDLKGYGAVWFYPEGIVNILSLSNLQQKQRVKYNSTLNEGLLVYKADSTTWSFRPRRACSSLMLKIM